jgi:predicted molibdopterin-dependent oxidoreductase YjgC
MQSEAKIVVAHSQATDVDGFASVVLRYEPGTEETLAAGLATAAGMKGADARLSTAKVAEETGVPEAAIKEAAAILKEGRPAVVTTHSIRNLDHGLHVEETLASLAVALEGTFDCFGLRANDEGADLLGATPGAGGLDTHGILKACLEGKIKALWLLGVDLFAEGLDRALVERALESVEFLVVQDLIETEAMGFASVVLPMTAPAESVGTWTNVERRVQRFDRVLPPKGDAKPAWLAAVETMRRIAPAEAVYNASEVMELIAKEVPAFAWCSYEAIGPEGFLLEA